MSATPAEVVDRYIQSWKGNDFEPMRSLLTDDLDFVGPIETLDNADAQHEAIKGLSQMKDDIVVHKIWVDGADVLVWYDLHTKIAEPAPVAEWYHVEDGKITSIRVVFDARPFSPPEEN